MMAGVALNFDHAPSEGRARVELQAAIARVADTERAIDKARRARGRISARMGDAAERLREARAAIRAAEADGQKTRIAHLLSDTAQDARTLEELRRAADAIEAEESALMADGDLLDGAIAARRDDLRIVMLIRAEAVGKVLRASAQDVFDEIRRLRQRAMTLQHALTDGFPIGTLERLPATNELHDFKPDPTLADRIAEVAKRLETEPDLEIPSFT